MGSCGWTNTDSDMIAAVSHTLYDQYTTTPGNPNNNDLCGKMIDVSYGGKTVRVKIVDRCEGCQEYDVDLTTTAFSQLADLGVGRLSGATWQLV
ncbi:plant expansin [Tilletiaria anomala UBC 951]|uniref:Plant expansin n=1 Tax=Tilletiaria anomala (strain ATCC 24038 / CBS 436.72 / UBC 951) TaxID=1037660 RepID=A0A066VNW5_TILAU|nr:plant expansin [Tilletiaria anomala UBC 951]KDN40270.1 plant expansin [Tilletiaria anomala UBC 951]